MSTEKLFWDMVRGGKKPLEKLPSRFEGKGAKAGYRYYRLQRNVIAFLYEVTHAESREKHYEVFYCWIDADDNKEMYPYEDEVLNELETFKNNAAAMQRWIEVTRNAGQDSGNPV